jgi:hypothetical protein
MLFFKSSLFCPVFGAADTGPVVDYIKKTHNLLTPTAAAAAKKQQRKKVARPKATAPTTPQIKVTGVPVPDRPLPPSVKGAGTRIPTMLPVPSSTRAPVPMSYSSDFSTGADHYFDSHAEYCPVETEQVSRVLSLRGTYFIEELTTFINYKKKL